MASLPPSQVKKMYARLCNFKGKSSEKSYQLSESKKANKKLKLAVSDIKNTNNELTCKLEASQAEYVQVKQADDEKIRQLETENQQLEFEKTQALKKSAA